MPQTIALVYDLRDDYIAEGLSPEDAAEFDREDTIAAIESALQKLGYRTDRVGNVKALCRRLCRGDRWDLVFNIAEGLGGRCRESQAPALLEAYDIAYTFSDPLVCALTLDKALAKQLVQAAGLPTPRFAVVRGMEDVATVTLDYALFAKPVAEGTGKGIDGRSRLDSPEELQSVCESLLGRFRQPVLVEEFLPGREFTVGVLGNGPDAFVLGAIEVGLRNEADPDRIYGYEEKEKCESLVRYSPVRDGPLMWRLAQLALASCQVLECRDAARVDLRLDGRAVPNFIEINPLPGLHPEHSDLPMIATAVGMPYHELIGAIVENAFARARSRPCRAAFPC